MWSKREQVWLWTTAYMPLILIVIYRFIDSNNYLKTSSWALWLAVKIDKTLFDFLIVIGIIFISLLIYRWTATWLFKNYDQQLKAKQLGMQISVRQYQRLSVNDYSFFLMTLLLPLITLDHSSVINLVVTLLIIFIIIIIYVKTNFLSVCPVFFMSGRSVFNAVISDQPKSVEEQDPSIRKEVIIITREKSLNLNYKFRTVKLISNIYYLTRSDENHEPED